MMKSESAFSQQVDLRISHFVGNVELQEGDTDRRRRHVVMTADGKRKYLEAKRLWNTAQKRFHRVFGAAEAEALRATLLAIAHDERLATLED